MSLIVEVLPGHSLELLPERLAFDPDQRCLLVADAHVGKAVSFRRLGVPVPGGTTVDALARLDRALHRTGARHLIFLGDLLHSQRTQNSASMAQLLQWRHRHASVQMTLVRGNHDLSAGDPPPGLGVDCVNGPLLLGPWALVHQPEVVQGAYALAGHVHPGAVLSGRAHDRLRLPCFRFGEHLGLLPAFGDFTGLHVPTRLPTDRLFVIADGRVLSV